MSDELLNEAKEVSLKEGRVSVSYLQRRLRIGYVRAARIADQLAEQGFCEKDFDDDLCGRLIIPAPNTACSGQGLCPECDSAILPSQYCMMGHWCGERPATNA